MAIFLEFWLTFSVFLKEVVPVELCLGHPFPSGDLTANQCQIYLTVSERTLSRSIVYIFAANLLKYFRSTSLSLSSAPDVDGLVITMTLREGEGQAEPGGDWGHMLLWEPGGMLILTLIPWSVVSNTVAGEDTSDAPRLPSDRCLLDGKIQWKLPKIISHLVRCFLALMEAQEMLIFIRSSSSSL